MRRMAIAAACTCLAFAACGGDDGGTSASDFDPYDSVAQVEQRVISESNLSEDAKASCSVGDELPADHFEFACVTRISGLPFQKITVNWDAKDDSAEVSADCTIADWQARGLQEDTDTCDLSEPFE